MFSPVRRHATRHGVAYLALFVSLGGTATAATALVTNSSQIAPNVVTSSHVKDASLDAADLGGSSVKSEQIAAGAVSDSELQTGAVSGSKIANDAVQSSNLFDGSVRSADLANGDVRQPDLAVDAVGSPEIQDGSVTPADLARAPGAAVFRTTPQAIGRGVAAPVAFDAEFFDDAGAHDAADPTKLVAPVSGRYLIIGSVRWQHLTDAHSRSIAIRTATGATLSSQSGTTSDIPEQGEFDQQVSVVANLVKGQAVQLVARHGSDRTLTVDPHSQSSAAFELQYLTR